MDIAFILLSLILPSSSPLLSPLSMYCSQSFETSNYLSLLSASAYGFSRELRPWFFHKSREHTCICSSGCCGLAVILKLGASVQNFLKNCKLFNAVWSKSTAKCYKGTGANGYGAIEILHYYYYYCYYFFYHSLCWCSFCAPAGTNHAPSQSFCSNTKHLSEDLCRSQHADLLNLCHNSCL